MTSRPSVVVVEGPEYPALSAWARPTAAERASPTPRALIATLRRVRAELEGQAIDVVTVVPSGGPDLVAAARRLSDRVLVFHEVSVSFSRVKEVALRAAFSAVDLTVVADEASLRDAVRLGADPDRVAVADDDVIARALREPPRQTPAGAMSEAAASVFLDALELAGVVRLAERLTPERGVNVVNYHRVLPIEEHRTYGRPQMALSEPTFEAQLDTMSIHHGFTRVESAHDADARGRVAVTFDDGYEDNFRVALPVLERFSVPACIFIVTNLIGREDALFWDRVGLSLFAYWKAGARGEIGDALPERARGLEHVSSFVEARQVISDVLSDLNDMEQDQRARAVAAAEALVPQLESNRTMLSWHEVEEMSKRGIEFGSHTKNHVCLDELSLEEAKDELFGSQTALEERLGDAASKLTALPRGKLGPLSESVLQLGGFRGVMTTEAAVNRADGASLFVHRRDGKMLTLKGRHHPAKLRLELTGLFDKLRSRLG